MRSRRHVLAAVDHQHLAGDETGFVAGEIHHCAGEVFRVQHSGHALLLGERLDDRLGNDVLGRLGVDDSRSNAVDRDVPATELGGAELGEADDAPLGLSNS